MTDFEVAEIATGEATIHVRRSGSGPPLLLLHGFPQTHLMWRETAPRLRERFTVVCADLRGYGSSSCPASTPDHLPYSKRSMARDMVSVMEQLGFGSFAVAGHDRGARVAYRLALDHPRRIEALAVLDVVPTISAWDHADAAFALAFWPWSLLAQPEPLPELVLSRSAAAVVDHALSEWGTPASTFPAEVRAAYAGALGDPAHAHAICEEYRAAAGVDREHDLADGARGRRIACPVLVLWSAGGALDVQYAKYGGPLAIWRGWCEEVAGHAINAGHFFPEESPQRTAQALQAFFERPARETPATRLRSQR